MSIKSGTTIYITPSGVYKERLEADQIFEMNDEGEVTNSPSDTFLRQSQCTPLYMLVYKMRGAGAVIHSHSKHAVLATLTTNEDTFKISNFEMIKGIKHGVTEKSLRNSDTLEVPIIENTPSESELVNDIENVLRNYPSCQAVLVRRHGVYVWGKN